MLKKKYVVQKSIRIDAQLSEDLERLAKILDRPQSELINMAIENLIHSNRAWFKQFYFIDVLSRYFENGDEHVESEVFHNGVIDKVSITRMADHSSILKWSTEDGHSVIDNIEHRYDDTPEDDAAMLEKLLELAVTLDIESDAVSNYLNKRLDYK